MASVNKAILIQSLRRSEWFNGFAAREAENLTGFLQSSVLPDLESKIKMALSKGLVSEPRLKSLRGEIQKIVHEGYKIGLTKTDSSINQVAKDEAKFQTGMLGKNTPLDWNFSAPNLGMLKSERLEVRGELVPKWFDHLDSKTSFNVYKEMRIGVASGESVPQIVNRVAGTVDKSKKELRTFVRTSLNQASAETREETYAANSDIIKGVQIVATLDERTSEICQEQDGKVYEIGEGKRPPFHFNCRTTTVPVLKSWKELGINLKDVPQTTRASMDGQVPATMTYKDWDKTKQDIEIAKQSTTELVNKNDILSDKQLTKLLDVDTLSPESTTDLLMFQNKIEAYMGATSKTIVDAPKVHISKILTKDSATAESIYVKETITKINLFNNTVGKLASPSVKNLFEGTSVTIKRSFRPGQSEPFRAFSNPAYKEIFLGDKDKPWILFHELGHFFDNRKSMRLKAFEYLESRSKGVMAPLNTLMKIKDRHHAHVDKFVHPYVGKVYGKSFTEVYSMGLQNFVSYEQMLKFAKTDFQHFSLVLRALRGEI